MDIQEIVQSASHSLQDNRPDSFSDKETTSSVSEYPSV